MEDFLPLLEYFLFSSIFLIEYFTTPGRSCCPRPRGAAGRYLCFCILLFYYH